MTNIKTQSVATSQTNQIIKISNESSPCSYMLRYKAAYSNSTKTVSRGFTLIEMMITVAIVAVLAAIAIPSYQNYILKAHRKEAISQIYSLTERLERARSSLMSYSSFDDYKSSEFTRYQYSIDVADDGGSYIITAEALTSQLNDKCGNLIYKSDNSWQFGDNSLDESMCL